MAPRMYREGLVRGIYSREAGRGAIVVFECDDVAQAKRLFGEFPLAQAGLLSAESYGTKPPRGIA